jgi:hypothetical protein
MKHSLLSAVKLITLHASSAECRHKINSLGRRMGEYFLIAGKYYSKKGEAP